MTGTVGSTAYIGGVMSRHGVPDKLRPGWQPCSKPPTQQGHGLRRGRIMSMPRAPASSASDAALTLLRIRVRACLLKIGSHD